MPRTDEQWSTRMNNAHGALKLFHIKTWHIQLRWSWFCWNSQLGHGAFEAARRFMYEIPISFLAAKDLHCKYCIIMSNIVKSCIRTFSDAFRIFIITSCQVLDSLSSWWPASQDTHVSHHEGWTLSAKWASSAICTPSLKNSSKPDCERQLAGMWKCRVLYIVFFIWTTTNTKWKCLVCTSTGYKRDAAWCHDIYSCSKLVFQAAPGRNANPFTIEVWTWTSTEKIRDHFHNWLGACPGFRTGMPIHSSRS